LYLYSSGHLPDLPSFPTRRSSDLSDKKHVRIREQLPHHLLADVLLRGHARHHDTCGRRNNERGNLCNQAIANGQQRIDLCRLTRSEEHTSELQSRENLVCRLLLEK